MKRRIINLILALALVVSLLPVVNVSAANGYYWPVPGHFHLSQGYHDNNAIDIADGSIGGATVVAAIGGTVRKCYYCTSQHLGSFGDCGGFGTGMIIDGDDGRTYQYAHMEGGSIPANVYAGARVEAGQTVGRVGTTGNSSGNHLHFAISNVWDPWGTGPDPYAFLEQQGCIPAIDFSWPTGNAANKYAVYETNAVLVTQVSAGSGSLANATTAGIELYDGNGHMIGSKSEATSAAFRQYGTSYIWYDINAELGCTLEAGTSYYYLFYVVNNGNYYYSDTMSFTTLDHSYGDWSVTQAANCEQGGYRTRTCSTCGYVDTEITAALGHNWQEVQVQQPTATQAGFRITQCANCQKIDVETLPATGTGNLPFTDLTPGAFYNTAVAWAVENKITGGTSATTFSPMKNCSRAEVLTFLWRANGSPEPNIVVNPFWDVHPNTFYYKAVLWAVEKGITGGISANEFGTMKNVTRGQFVTFLWRAEGKPAPSGGNSFVDLAPNAFYTDAVIWAAEKDITGGTGTNTFSPEAPCNRGQVVTFLYRAYA